MSAKHLLKKCQQYIQQNLRAPSKLLVMRWGKQFKMLPQEIEQIVDKLQLRHQLGIQFDIVSMH
jgi:hypothetical protein